MVQEAFWHFFTSFLFLIQTSSGCEQGPVAERRTGRDPGSVSCFQGWILRGAQESGEGIRAWVQVQLYAISQPTKPFAERHQVFQSARHSASSALTCPAASHLQPLLLASAAFLPQKPSFCWSLPGRRLWGEFQPEQRQRVPPAAPCGAASPIPLQPGCVSGGRGGHGRLPQGYWPFRLTS